jgi:hypothetical protein
MLIVAGDYDASGAVTVDRKRHDTDAMPDDVYEVGDVADALMALENDLVVRSVCILQHRHSHRTNDGNAYGPRAVVNTDINVRAQTTRCIVHRMSHGAPFT